MSWTFSIQAFLFIILVFFQNATLSEDSFHFHMPKYLKDAKPKANEIKISELAKLIFPLWAIRSLFYFLWFLKIILYNKKVMNIGFSYGLLNMVVLLIIYSWYWSGLVQYTQAQIKSGKPVTSGVEESPAKKISITDVGFHVNIGLPFFNGISAFMGQNHPSNHQQ